jgi:hypothetical protein
VAVSLKEVPAQKASIAEPFSFVAIIYTQLAMETLNTRACRTGRAGLIEVASKDAASPTMERVPNAR